LGWLCGIDFMAFAAGLGRHGALAKQHRNWPDDRVLRQRRGRRSHPRLAIMLGANVGTTLIVQVLSFNVAAIAPVLFLSV
jgi:phosphate:Na+ symporter